MTITTKRISKTHWTASAEGEIGQGKSANAAIKDLHERLEKKHAQKDPSTAN